MSLQAHIDNARSRGDIMNGFQYYHVPNTPYALSVQAGSYKYSEPRENFPKLTDYESVEIAIFKNDEWFDVEAELPAIAEFAGFESGNAPVAGYVPLADVVKIEAMLIG